MSSQIRSLFFLYKYELLIFGVNKYIVPFIFFVRKVPHMSQNF